MNRLRHFAQLSRSRLSFRAVIPAAAALALGTMSGCVLQLQEQTVTFSAPHAAGTAVDVKARNGSITVMQGSVQEVGIVATLRMTSADRIAQTSITAQRDTRQVLVIRAEPPAGGWKSREGVSFEVTVPEAQGVVARSDNGAISISGLAGTADVQTSNGAISVEGHGGAVKARTSNGRIEVTDAAGAVDLRTSNGAIVAKLSDENPGPAQVRTSNGAVTLQVGRGFAGDLSIRTSNGSISVPDTREVKAPFEIMSFSRRSAALRFGEGQGSSQIQTSNGSVRVVLSKS